MSERDIAHVILAIGILLACAHGAAYLFEKLRQPRLVGEVLAGFLLGPAILGHLSPRLSEYLFNPSLKDSATAMVLGFLYWLGLMLLMFISGSEANRVLTRGNRRETAWIVGVGTPIPFFLVLYLGAYGFIPLESLMGPASHKTALLLVLSVAAAITSIPVISRIFFDLKILHTRFAGLVLGTAVLEDILLWSVLAVATALAKGGADGEAAKVITLHVAVSVAYVVVAMGLGPVFLRILHRQRWNIILKASPLGYVVLILFSYVIVAAGMGVNLVFAAFLAGFGVVGGLGGEFKERFSKPLASVQAFSTSTFIPIYFALVGYRLAIGGEFPILLTAGFLVASSALAIACKSLAARLAGFRGLDIVNLAIATNARGGPGIVLASIAFDQGIINGAFYVALVLTAILTSQAAGVWLWYVLKRGWPLLSEFPEDRPARDPA